MTENDREVLPELGADLEAKAQRFSPADMIICEQCERTNPPTRTNCIYCAAALPVAEAKKTEVADATEPTPASGYCVTVPPKQTALSNQSTASEIASLLHLKPEDLNCLNRSTFATPIAYTATFDSASKLSDSLSTLGLETEVISDPFAHLATGNRRIRAFEISDEKISGLPFSGDGRMSVRWDDLVCLVEGRLLINQLEIEERRKRGRMQPLDRRELFSDEAVFDLYSRTTNAGWRISAGSFDFSCLGERKGMTAFENFAGLISLLCESGSKISLNNSYLELRSILANVWPLVQQTRKGEWR